MNTRDDYLIRLEHGQPITFGANNDWCVTHPPGGFGLEVKPTADAEHVVTHDESVADPAYAFALSRLPALDLRYTPIGVFRDVPRPTYDELVNKQVETAKSKQVAEPEAELANLLNSGDTWTIL